MAKNCGCKPCSKPIATKEKQCKPFSMCVGNNTFYWDGKCASIQPRQYQIPDGTYTAITFQGGCIVGVDQAPIPQYTPQVCCDGEEAVATGGTNANFSLMPTSTNIAIFAGGMLDVSPSWGTSKTVSVTGSGTANSPWKPEVKISKGTGNRLVANDDGLMAELVFAESTNFKLTGKGTQADPYRLEAKALDAKLPEINKEEIEGNGFTIHKDGTVEADADLQVVTNLEFTSSAFTVMNAGSKTQVIVDEQRLLTGAELVTKNGVKGKGTTASPVELDLTVDVVSKMLDVINGNATLKQKLKTILGV